MQPILLRALDIIISLAGIIFVLPVFLVVFVAGLFDFGSPLFFQRRVGKNQNSFTLVKFRTMAINTDSVGTHLVDETLISRFGHLLRKTKLDELPQLVNVFLGHMTLVGPRPCLPNQTELIDEREIRNIFRVRPGITGLGQVNGVDMSTPRKLARYDSLMIDSLCFKLYIELIIATAIGIWGSDRVQTGYSLKSSPTRRIPSTVEIGASHSGSTLTLAISQRRRLTEHLTYQLRSFDGNNGELAKVASGN